MTETLKTCLLVTTPRSGSWWLAEGLDATSLVGLPEEYFEAGTFFTWRDDLGLPETVPYDTFVREAVAYSTTDNGVGGAKMHWSQFQTMARRLREVDELAELSDVELIDRFFPEPHYVHLVRRDKARQAISYFRAVSSLRWWHLEGEPEAPEALEPDFVQIRWMEAMLTEQENKWQAHLAAHGRPVLDLFYEDILGDRRAAVTSVLELLGIEPPEDLELSQSRLRLQRDAVTDEWAARYNELRPSLPGLPQPWRWSRKLRRIYPADEPDPAEPTVTT